MSTSGYSDDQLERIGRLLDKVFEHKLRPEVPPEARREADQANSIWNGTWDGDRLIPGPTTCTPACPIHPHLHEPQIPDRPYSYHVYDPPGWYHGGPCKGAECLPPHEARERNS